MMKVEYLQELCNKYGDFYITTRFDDDKRTKWVSVMQCWENIDRRVNGRNGLWHLQKATDMSCPENMIFFDLDEEPIIKNYEKLIKVLDEDNIPYWAYTSGGKGYHIHVVYSFGLLTKITKQILREKLLSRFKADTHKSSYKHMILIPNEKHRKTGKTKTLIRTNRQWIALKK